MKKKNALLSFGLGLTLIFISSTLYAQYTGAVGIRFGGTSGVTGKYFFKAPLAVEGIIGTFGNGFSITGLLEKYLPFEGARGLYLYYGGGAHIAFYNGEYSSHFGREVDYRQSNQAGFGINGILGIEYLLPVEIPIAISLDLKPFLEIGSDGRAGFAPDPSIGIKFIFK